MLHDAGVPSLAGTDAPNPGTAHGSSLHRELELLVRAGLSNEAALAAASSVPARSFGLRDRGRVATGLRADQRRRAVSVGRRDVFSCAPMTPVNLSRFKELVFWARGDGGELRVMVFASRLGNIPAVRPFKPAAEWQEFVMPLASFSGIDGSDLRGVLFSAGVKPGPFPFAIDDVRFR